MPISSQCRSLPAGILSVQLRWLIANCVRYLYTAPGGEACRWTRLLIRVNERAKARTRYLAALTDVTQAEIVDRAAGEFAERHADEIAAGMEQARGVLASSDAAVAAYLLDEPVEAVERIAGKLPASAGS